MRLLELKDLPWIHYLFHKRYPSSYCYPTAERWYREMVMTNPFTFYAVRTDDAFLIATWVIYAWIPGDPEAHVAVICADENAQFQAITLLRASIAWAKTRHAAKWKVASDTDYDLSALAKRVGATELTARFELDLRA